MQRVFCLVCVVSLVGCAATQSGFHREQLREGAGGTPVVSNEAIRQEFQRRPQLPKPFRLAIAFREPVVKIGGGAFSAEQGRLSIAEKQALLDWSRDLPKGEVSAVIPLSRNEREMNEADLRLAAARRGADALLLVSAMGEDLSQSNDLALTYLLVLPTLFVRGTDIASLFVANASLFDVRNEYLYLTAEGQAEQKMSRPFFHQRASELSAATRTEAWLRLKAELTQQFSALLGRSEKT